MAPGNSEALQAGQVLGVEAVSAVSEVAGGAAAGGGAGGGAGGAA